ncbi:2-C-methyl-D-erythritol 2,4-cyclodiphosphate synthase [Moritella viscosa]|nr:2-C-methyl-D-erythritol 2,4-cyclodiphosphate synthase [Moritella viscosa]
MLSIFDDRKLILYLVNLALDEDLGLYTADVNTERVKDIKLKKTRKIAKHFESINEKYKEYGISISSRQYFHRLLMNFLQVKLMANN